MSITVRQLIAKLKKMPSNAVVAWRDHDQSEDELNGYVNCVEEAPEAVYLREDRPRAIVVLSP